MSPTRSHIHPEEKHAENHEASGGGWKIVLLLFTGPMNESFAC